MFAVALVVGYFVIQSTGYAVHKALHQPFLGPIHRTHDVHHKVMYTPKDYLDVSYREVPGEAQPFKYYAGAAIPLIAAVFLFLPVTTAIALTAELLLVAWANDWLHQKVHIKGYWLERYSWFRHLRALHWHHHVDDTKNLGIFSWFTDRILGTYEEPLTTPSYLTEPDVIWQVDAPPKVTYIVKTEIETEVETFEEPEEVAELLQG
jgi:sterol desaturase/sphingolipid hydroxylase (fatty acid hydroxylase superfamily)